MKAYDVGRLNKIKKKLFLNCKKNLDELVGWHLSAWNIRVRVRVRK